MCLGPRLLVIVAFAIFGSRTFVFIFLEIAPVFSFFAAFGAVCVMDEKSKG